MSDIERASAGIQQTQHACERQRGRIRHLSAAGQDPRPAEELLDIYQRSLVIMVEHRDDLLAEMGKEHAVSLTWTPRPARARRREPHQGLTLVSSNPVPPDDFRAFWWRPSAAKRLGFQKWDSVGVLLMDSSA